MKKIFMLAIASTIILSFSFNLSAQVVKKDTCPCFIHPVKKDPKPPHQWKDQREKPKGLITSSFNDSIVIEDHTGGGYIFPEVVRIPERFYPPVVSNLGEIKGSFNRHISVKVFPYPNRRCHYWYDDFFWLPLLLLLGLIGLIAYLLTRSQPAPSVTVHVPPAPTAPTKHGAATPPAVDLKDICKDAAATGSTVVVFPDGGFKIIPPIKKEEKPSADVKGEKEEAK